MFKQEPHVSEARHGAPGAWVVRSGYLVPLRLVVLASMAVGALGWK
jgi:hypothetical protein